MHCRPESEEYQFSQISIAEENLLSSAASENWSYLSFNVIPSPIYFNSKTVRNLSSRSKLCKLLAVLIISRISLKTPSLHAYLVAPTCFRTSCEILQASGLEREQRRLVDGDKHEWFALWEAELTAVKGRFWKRGGGPQRVEKMSKGPLFAAAMHERDADR